MTSLENIIESLNNDLDENYNGRGSEFAREVLNQNFFSKIDELLQAKASKSGVASGANNYFLSAYGGFLLGEHDGGACVLAQMSETFTYPVYWSTRRALFVPLRGVLDFQTYRLSHAVDNQVFDRHVHIAKETCVSLSPGEEFYKSSEQIVTFRRAPESDRKALMVAFYSKPFGFLDWIFDQSGKAEKAVMSTTQDTIKEKVIEAFPLVQSGRPATATEQRLKQLANDENYLVRWAALNALWQTGRHDGFVQNAVAADPHPEISEQATGFVSEALQC